MERFVDTGKIGIWKDSEKLQTQLQMLKSLAGNGALHQALSSMPPREESYLADRSVPGACQRRCVGLSSRLALAESQSTLRRARGHSRYSLSLCHLPLRVLLDTRF